MKKVLVLISILVCSIASASDLSFIPAETEAQKDFKGQVESGRYEKALRTWPEAFGGTSFSLSMDGKALRSFVIAQAGMPVAGLKILIRETQVDQIAAAVMALWQPILNTYVTELPPGLEMNASWKRLFSSRNVVITKASEIPYYLNQASRMSNTDPDKTRLLWKVITTAPLWNDTSNAVKALNILKSYKQSVIGQDQIDLATARVLYQKGEVDKAIEHYMAVPKSSDYWVESLEERAWARLRKGENDKAVADIATLLSPPLAPLLGPEPYFLAQLTSLKICDYPKILKTSKIFKERHKERLNEITTLAKTGSNKGLLPLLQGFDEKGFNIRGAGPNVQWMPRNFMRDRVFSSNMRYRLSLLAELETAKDIGGDNADIQNIIAENQSHADMARAKAVARLRQIATQDTEEYRITINKLHIVEAEVIQRLYVDERLKGQRKDVQVAKDDKNSLRFEYSDKEMWMDELDHLKSTVKDCPALPATKGASL